MYSYTDGMLSQLLVTSWSKIMSLRQRLMAGFKEIKLLPGWSPAQLSRLMYYYTKLQPLVKLRDRPEMLSTEGRAGATDETSRVAESRDRSKAPKTGEK